MHANPMPTVAETPMVLLLLLMLHAYNAGEEAGTERNTVVFKLHVTCKRKNGIKDTASGRMVGGELENEKGEASVKSDILE